SVALLAVSAILFASSFRAAPSAADSHPGFYPPLPALAPAPGQEPDGPPQPNPLITVSLPTDTITVSVNQNQLEPVNTTLIDPGTTGGNNYVGFQGDF